MMNDIYYNTLDYPDEDVKRYVEDCDEWKGCFKQLICAVLWIIILFCMVTMCSCSSPRQTTARDSHHVEDMLLRIDSLVRIKTVNQQDSSWRELVIKQFQSIKEKNDTSHMLVVDSSGKVIKETIVINNVKEVNNEKDRQEREYLMHCIETMDSTISSQNEQIKHIEELLQEKEDIIEVPAPLSWWQKTRLKICNVLLILLALYAGWWVVKKKAWWLSLIKKII